MKNDRFQFTRRDLVRLLGAGAAAGVVAEWDRAREWFEGSLQAQGVKRLTFPNGAIIRTAVKDIDPNTIVGKTLMHEHLGTGRPGRGGGPATVASQDAQWMAEELIAAKKVGLGAIVAANTSMPAPEIVEYYKGLTEKSGVHVIPAGAYYNVGVYPPDFKDKSEDAIADVMAQAAMAGRFGAFGEMGVAGAEADMDPEEKRVFRACGKAVVKTGIPVFTHNNYATGPNVPMDMALRQLDQLEAGGAKPSQIALGHVCCMFDPKAEVMKQLAKRGAYVAFDRVTRQQQWVSDPQRIQMIQAFLDAGYVDHLLLASDNTGQLNASTGEVKFYPGPLSAREGGPGHARPLILFVPLLLKAGIKEETVRQIMEDNPRRFLAFTPKMG